MRGLFGSTTPTWGEQCWILQAAVKKTAFSTSIRFAKLLCQVRSTVAVCSNVPLQIKVGYECLAVRPSCPLNKRSVLHDSDSHNASVAF